MDRLEAQFGDRIEFRHLNVDNETARETLLAFGVRGRSQYLLVTAEGDVLHAWAGPIGHLEETMAAEMTQALGAP